jgi:ribulose-phosphate 3-epimerase
MSIKISASILNADFTCLKDQIDQAILAGVQWIHLDIMDGHFVPNISMGPSIASTCRKITDIPIDAHLMIENPDSFIEQFVSAGVNYISVHVENNPHIHRTLQKIRSLGCKPGIVLNPGTPPDTISSILNMVDLVLVMTVNPGFGGQKFLYELLPKIKRVREMITTANLSAYVQVDGGISPTTLPLAYEAGADIFVVGSEIFNNTKGIKQSIKQLIQSIK